MFFSEHRLKIASLRIGKHRIVKNIASLRKVNIAHPYLPVEEVRGQLSDPALGWVDRRRRFQQGGAQGRWRRVAKPGSTRMRFWFHTTGASGLGEVLSSEANTPGCWPAMRSQMKATINGRRTFTFCESFLFVCFCSKSSVLEKESSDLKVLAKLQYIQIFSLWLQWRQQVGNIVKVL